MAAGQPGETHQAAGGEGRADDGEAAGDE
ncbi:hypothetical protein GA0115252_17274, partial [Streptomyces sp. DfronAA-171]